MREITPDELAQALDSAEEWPGREMDWPYIDARHGDVIDGRLSSVVEWLCANYAITPRTAVASPEAVAERLAERDAQRKRDVEQARTDWLTVHPLERTENGLRRAP